VHVHCRIAALTAALVLALTAAPAGAQSPFSPLPSQPATTQQTTTQATPNSTTSGSGGGLATWAGILIVAGGVAVIVAIGMYIARDARRRAPLKAGDSEVAHLAPSAHQGARQAKQKARARQKAARAQRRRNR